MSPRLAFALDVATRAGRATLGSFRTGARFDTKEDETPVTQADRQAERTIREAIAAAFPGEAVLGEEEGGEAGGATRWVIDPIDGTKSFVCGVPLFATLLSYERDGRPELGVAYFPALDELVYAERGGGTFANGRPCRVSDRPGVAGGVICAGGHRSMRRHGRADGLDRLAERAMVTRTWGDAFGHVLVATGRAEAMLDPVVSRWDLSAVSLIVEEAGGRFTDFSGGCPFARGDFGLEAVSSNGLVHDEVLREFAS